ncbi:transcriptional regulator [Methylomonas paludis]|uniref:Glycine cleavage system transcriptional repressor n=1 Tax=Methylomonas paludis TaxID=1173101 RepID=A0A975MQ18_9GAMM|nr:ACT domain-containing protein [Methylomonas paludis]QWF71411.1 transcriptional regulator [Methylomonas paludis]
MQLAISVLGNKTKDLVVETLAAVSACQCHVLELRTSNLTQLTALYVLINGNWNHIAKLEGLLDAIAKRNGVNINFMRPEKDQLTESGVPYTLETISLDKKDILVAVTTFLVERGIVIEEITASSHQTAFFSNTVFSSKFILLVPDDVRILSLREEFLDFCDNLNIDAILEPIKR